LQAHIIAPDNSTKSYCFGVSYLQQFKSENIISKILSATLNFETGLSFGFGLVWKNCKVMGFTL